MADALLHVFGWRSLLFHGDPCVLDRWLWLRRYLRHGDARTFDAGCGDGVFSMYARRAGNSVVAASFSEDDLSKARRRATFTGATGIAFRTLDLRELGAQHSALGEFDQVICLESIEHVRDDERLLQSLADLLRPGGRLLLTTPFAGHRPLYSEDPTPDTIEDGSHVRYGYSQRQLRHIIEKAGFDVASEGFVSGVVSQTITSVMRRTRWFGYLPAWLIVLPLRPLVVLDRPLTRLLRYPYLSLAVCAERR